jgi:hypothetical protein
MGEDYGGAHRGAMNPQLENTITALGLEFGIATQFTSFVAVEEQTITTGGHSRKVAVPVNMPEGMSYQGIQGYGRLSGVVGGVPGGAAGGVIGGIIGAVPSAAPPPPPPAMAPAPSMIRTSLPAFPEKLAPALRAMMKPENATRQVEVNVLLTDATPATLKLLADAGLVLSISPGANLMATGRIAVASLPGLARISAVRYIVQRTSR